MCIYIKNIHKQINIQRIYTNISRNFSFRVLRTATFERFQNPQKRTLRAQPKIQEIRPPLNDPRNLNDTEARAGNTQYCKYGAAARSHAKKCLFKF